MDITGRGARDDANWHLALAEAERRLVEAERQCSRLRMAIRIFEQKIRNGAEWPGTDTCELNSAK